MGARAGRDGYAWVDLNTSGCLSIDLVAYNAARGSVRSSVQKGASTLSSVVMAAGPQSAVRTVGVRQTPAVRLLGRSLSGPSLQLYWSVWALCNNSSGTPAKTSGRTSMNGMTLTRATGRVFPAPPKGYAVYLQRYDASKGTWRNIALGRTNGGNSVTMSVTVLPSTLSYRLAAPLHPSTPYAVGTSPTRVFHSS